MSEDTFTSHLPTVLAAAAGAVAAAVLGSFLGTAGTMTGLAIGSLASGTLSWWGERGIRRAAAVARAKADASHRARRELHPDETAVITRVISEQHKPGKLREHWRRIALLALAAALIGGIVLTVVYLAAGKPLAQVVNAPAPARPSPTAPVTTGSAQPTSTPDYTPTTAAPTTSAPATATPTTSAPAATPTQSPTPATTAPVTSAPATVTPTH